MAATSPAKNPAASAPAPAPTRTAPPLGACDGDGTLSEVLDVGKGPIDGGRGISKLALVGVPDGVGADVEGKEKAVVGELEAPSVPEVAGGDVVIVPGLEELDPPPPLPPPLPANSANPTDGGVARYTE